MSTQLNGSVDRAVAHWTSGEDRIRESQEDRAIGELDDARYEVTVAIAETLQGILAIMLAQNGVEL